MIHPRQMQTGLMEWLFTLILCPRMHLGSGSYLLQMHGFSNFVANFCSILGFSATIWSNQEQQI
jgi:hypothetical protein